MSSFRVFLSYSHEDRETVERVDRILRGLKLKPTWAKAIRPGSPFTDAIKGMITHPHIFMPLITEHSKERPWVHQETGYAIALNIPVLPLAIGIPPGEMISQLQAITIKTDLSDLKEKLGQVNFEFVVLPPPTQPGPIFQVADWRVLEMGHHARVLQRGGLSSFSIPNKEHDDKVWGLRDGDQPRSQYYHHMLCRERQALEVHAREEGCRLLIDPTVMTSGISPGARKIRLETLHEFLLSLSDDKAEVVCSPRARDANITILEDWFIAESRLRKAGEGWRQTFFNWHAPTAVRETRYFNQVFDGLLKEAGLSPTESRRAALTQIESVLAELEQEISQGGAATPAGQAK